MYVNYHDINPCVSLKKMKKSDSSTLEQKHIAFLCRTTFLPDMFRDGYFRLVLKNIEQLMLFRIIFGIILFLLF